MAAQDVGAGRCNVWFSSFYQLTSKVVWEASRTPRARRHHGGSRCRATPPKLGVASVPVSERGVECPECSSAHLEAVYAIGVKWRRRATERPVDPVAFARREARDRWLDVVTKADGAEFGWLQKPRRTVFASRWIDQALGGDTYLKELLLLAIRYVQGHDAPEAGRPFPYDRFSARLSSANNSLSSRQVAADLEAVFRKLEKARPLWVARHLYAHSQHLTRVGGFDESSPAKAPEDLPEQCDENSLLVGWAFRALEAARQSNDPAATLYEAIAQREGRSAADRARAAEVDWRWLMNHLAVASGAVSAAGRTQAA